MYLSLGKSGDISSDDSRHSPFSYSPICQRGSLTFQVWANDISCNVDGWVISLPTIASWYACVASRLSCSPVSNCLAVYQNPCFLPSWLSCHSSCDPVLYARPLMQVVAYLDFVICYKRYHTVYRLFDAFSFTSGHARLISCLYLHVENSRPAVKLSATLRCSRWDKLNSLASKIQFAVMVLSDFSTKWTSSNSAFFAFTIAVVAMITLQRFVIRNGPTSASTTSIVNFSASSSMLVLFISWRLEQRRR